MATPVEQLDELLSACALRDQKAFARLYKLASPKVFAVLLRVLKRRELAEEALQDTFVNIWHNADSYQAHKGGPMAWMCSIARYRAIDILRRTRTEVPLEDNEADTVDFSAGPYETVALANDSVSLQKCMEKLDSTQSKSIALAYREGYSHQELSQYLSKPLGTVKSWIRRGLQSLKECLENE